MRPSIGTRFNQCALVTSACLALLAVVESANVRGQQGIIPRDPPRLRIPQHAFSTWASMSEQIRKVEESSPDDGTLAKFMHEEPKKPNQVMGAINRFRARICWQMKDTHGEKFDSYEACKKFMERACRPGKDVKMDGDAGEHSSEKGYCSEYFPQDEKEAEKILEDMEAAEAAKKAKEAKAAEDAKKAEEARKAEAARKAKLEAEEAKKKAEAAEEAAKKAEEEAEKQKKADAAQEAAAKKPPQPKAREAAKGAAAAPSPAAVAAPAPGAPGGAPVPANEAWYYKGGGVDPGRYHMNEKLKLPTQGYWGRLVHHNDMESATSDWHSEFGNGDDKSMAEICKEQPENRWCHERGLGLTPHHSGSVALAISMGPIFLMFIASVRFI